MMRRGQFRFCVLPQGTKNSPAIFSRLTSLILRGLNYVSCLSFIDECVIIGRTFDEALLNLELVLNRFRYAGLKPKSKKARLFQKEIPYLGRIVSGYSYRVDPSKVAVVKGWQFPNKRSK